MAVIKVEVVRVLSIEVDDIDIERTGEKATLDYVFDRWWEHAYTEVDGYVQAVWNATYE